ncbi:cyclopropane fatty acyl phospholipid synthase [Pseudobythopirellula maris]|uniref:Cyclopropane fatty acyl phospholipid synthase n=1 Tax=Pseudobythopirellula maris TaxID=2527991 RepID=A0A5C5ZMP2_9BACT|nr:class I SAM-dependent methyltransferase [Pseudobythopirellula maris]TWT88689.1 cyclopropane fatty acyl phospholipid synthase [Pseudobythopirellula maris]
MPEATTTSSREEIADFYDTFNRRLIGDYLKGNPRIEEAIDLVKRSLPTGPARVLDIGCGLGFSSHEYALAHPGVEVLGVDISPENVRVASALFGSDRVRFEVSNLRDGVVEGPFDLIAMIDVHEHIPRDAWAECHASFRQWLAPSGALVMTIPSPEHQRYLMEHEPEGLQVVDEIITTQDIVGIAESIDATVADLHYVNVWKRSMYVHAVLRRDLEYGAPANRSPRKHSPAWFRRMARRLMRRRSRRAHVLRALGPEALEGL